MDLGFSGVAWSLPRLLVDKVRARGEILCPDHSLMIMEWGALSIDSMSLKLSFCVSGHKPVALKPTTLSGRMGLTNAADISFTT